MRRRIAYAPSILDTKGQLMLRKSSPRRLIQLTAQSFLALGLVATQAGAALPTKTVPPKQWAKTVCPALADFVSTFQSIDQQLSSGVSAPEAQEIILSGIETTKGTAADVVASIKRAGTPKASKGKQTSSAMAKGFRDMQDTLTGAQGVIADLPTDSLEAFANASQEVRDETVKELDEIFTSFKKLDKTVNRALNADKACKAIGA